MASTKFKPRGSAVTPDERQRQAIQHVHGPMLVVAGAGTGKTTVLTRRIAALIRQWDEAGSPRLNVKMIKHRPAPGHRIRV